MLGHTKTGKQAGRKTLRIFLDIGHDKNACPLKRIHRAADLASNGGTTGEFIKLLNDRDSAVRYWAAIGLLSCGEKGVAAGQAQLRRALADKSPAVACIAAEALARFGDANDAEHALKKLLQLADASKNSIFTAMLALNALDHAGDRAKPHAAAIAALPRKAKVTPPRMGNYLLRLIEKTTSDLK
jgi:uncharacterized sulfatase